LLSFLRGISKPREYARILAWPHIDAARANAAERAIARGDYENRGARNDGALVLVTKTKPALVVIAEVRAEAGGKPDLLMLHVAEVRGSGSEAPA